MARFNENFDLLPDEAILKKISEFEKSIQAEDELILSGKLTQREVNWALYRIQNYQKARSELKDILIKRKREKIKYFSNKALNHGGVYMDNKKDMYHINHRNNGYALRGVCL